MTSGRSCADGVIRSGSRSSVLEATAMTKSGKWEASDEGTGGLGDSATQTRQGRVHCWVLGVKAKVEFCRLRAVGGWEWHDELEGSRIKVKRMVANGGGWE